MVNLINDIEFLEATNARAYYNFGEKAYFSNEDSKVQNGSDVSGTSQDAVKKKVNLQRSQNKSLQHPVFPGGHPSRY